MTTTALEMNTLEFKPESIVSDEMYQAFLFFLYQLKGQHVAEGCKPKVKWPTPSKLSAQDELSCLSAAQKYSTGAESLVEKTKAIIERHEFEIKKFEHLDETIFVTKRPRKKTGQ